MATRSGYANLAAMAYGTPQPIVARLPDSEAIIPRLSLRSRANQLAAEPESEVRMQSFGRRGLSSQKTRCGLIGLASFIARSSITRHQSAICCSTCSRQDRSCLRSRCGSSARNVAALSPTRFTSVG